LFCLHRTGWIKTRPAQKLLVRVKFTGNSYSYRTCVNVNGHHSNTCKLVFTGTRKQVPDSYSYECECTLRLSWQRRFMEGYHGVHIWLLQVILQSINQSMLSVNFVPTWQVQSK